MPINVAGSSPAEFPPNVDVDPDRPMRSEGVSRRHERVQQLTRYDWGDAIRVHATDALVIDPPTGRVPALTAEGKERPWPGQFQFFGFRTDATQGHGWSAVCGSAASRGVCRTSRPDVMLPTAWQQPLPNLPDARATSTAAGACGQPRVCRADGRRLGHRRPLRSPPVAGGRWPVEHDALRVDEVLSGASVIKCW